MKRLLLCMLLCMLALSAVYAQEGEALSRADPASGAEEPGFFARFWAGFKETLFAPQIHKPFSVSGGYELTQNDRSSMLSEMYVMADYELSRNFGLGLRGGLSFGSSAPDHKLVTVMEGVFFMRLYIHDFGWIKPFVQTGLGISIDREQEYEYNDVLGEAALGIRAHYKGWFMETGFRYGYPFRLAFGAGFGHSFLP